MAAGRLHQRYAWAKVRGLIVAEHRLEPLQPDEIGPYIAHRLAEVGGGDAPRIEAGLPALLHEATGGIPAALNSVISALLDRSAAAGDMVISGDAIAAVLHDRADPAGEPLLLEDREDSEDAGPDALPGQALADAQRMAIEAALAEQDRRIAELQSEVATLRDGAQPTLAGAPDPDRLAAIEARLAEQEQAIKHMLGRLIAFFDRDGQGGPD